MSVEYFHNIHTEYSKPLLFHRLGMKKGAETDGEALRKIRAKADYCAALLGIHGAMVCLPLARVGGAYAARGITIPECGAAKALNGCTGVLLMASTIPDAKDRMREMDMGSAVVMDAVASLLADAGLDVLMDSFIKRNRQSKLTKRVSPGYGGLLLNFQREIYNALDLSVLGMSINDHFMLEPEKSVLALAGVF